MGLQARLLHGKDGPGDLCFIHKFPRHSREGGKPVALVIRSNFAGLHAFVGMTKGFTRQSREAGKPAALLIRPHYRWIARLRGNDGMSRQPYV